MLTPTTRLLLIAAAALLPLLALAAWLYRRLYREEAGNTARRVLKNSAVPFAARLGVRALDLVFAVILLGTLPPGAIGLYTFAALLVVQYFGTVAEFGLGVLLTREAARDTTAAPRLFGAALALRWLLSAAAFPAAAALIGAYALLARLGAGEAIAPLGQQVIWVLLLTLIPGAYSGAVTALYNAAERMEVPALVELVTAVLSLLARVGALLLGLGILGLAWAAVAVSTLTALIYLMLQLRHFFPPALAWDRALIRQLAPQALPLMLNNLLGAVFFRFDTLIIKAFGAGQGDRLVAQYNVAYQILGVALIVPPIITFAVFPLLARRAAGERAALAEAQRRTLQALLLLAFPLAAGLAVLAPDLVRLFTRRNAAEYLPLAADVLAILAWFLPLSFVNGLLQYVLIAVGRQAAITRAFALGAAFNLAANLAAMPLAAGLLGQPQLGLYAAALITILSEVVLLATFLPLLRREGLAPPLLALAWRPAAAALLMGALMLGLLAALPGAAWLAALAAPPIYLAALSALGAFGAEERALARRVIGWDIED
ncbi:MAG TPA: oligosaccharide flippase family protein [Roseiflexaceae bacterium]|nr:oligosaccharide flippase family protein [Roseiflexaceae bacterium]